MGPLIPLFWTFGDFSSRFQSMEVRPALFALDGSAFDVCPLRFTSGATPADLLMASMVASRCSLHACFSRGSMPDSIGRPPAVMYLSCCFVAGPGDLPDPGVTRVYLSPDVR